MTNDLPFGVQVMTSERVLSESISIRRSGKISFFLSLEEEDGVEAVDATIEAAGGGGGGGGGETAFSLTLTSEAIADASTSSERAVAASTKWQRPPIWLLVEVPCEFIIGGG